MTEADQLHTPGSISTPALIMSRASKSCDATVCYTNYSMIDRLGSAACLHSQGYAAQQLVTPCTRLLRQARARPCTSLPAEVPNLTHGMSTDTSSAVLQQADSHKIFDDKLLCSLFLRIPIISALDWIRQNIWHSKSTTSTCLPLSHLPCCRLSVGRW